MKLVPVFIKSLALIYGGVTPRHKVVGHRKCPRLSLLRPCVLVVFTALLNVKHATIARINLDVAFAIGFEGIGVRRKIGVDLGDKIGDRFAVGHVRGVSP